MFSALHGCISRIPHECLKKVERISICGQMHGIMFWKQGQAWSWNGSDEETAQVSKLVGSGPQPGSKKGSRVE